MLGATIGTRLSRAEQITESFYAWELRGRGWQIADYPVALEPVFRRCQFLPQYAPTAPLDDGRRPTLVSTLLDRARSLLTVPSADVAPESDPFEELPPHEAHTDDVLVTYRLQVAADFASSSDVATHLLRALSAALQPVSLELIGHAESVIVQVTCRAADGDHVRSSLEGYVPELSIVGCADLLEDKWQAAHETFVVDFGLSNEFFLPIAKVASFRVDPYIALVGGLSRATADEWVCLQVLFERARNPWDKAIAHALFDSAGTPMFADAPEFLPLAKEKTRTPLFAVVVRVGAQAPTGERAKALARSTGAFVLQFERPGSNELMPLANDDYPEDLHTRALIERQSYRTGMLLSADELIGLVHIPDASVRQATFLRDGKRTKVAPEAVIGHAYVLGESQHRGASTLVSLDNPARVQHMHVIGASGTGKSTLLVQLISQDIVQGNGVLVLDPHGDLIEDVLARIPEERHGDVIVFDPADEEWPVGLNVLRATTTLEKQLLASDLVSIFQRLSTSWGDSMGAVLANAVLAMLEHEEGGTLVDLRHFLLDEGFRKQFLRGVTDEEVQFFWTKGFPLVGTRSVGPILTRLDAFLRPKLIRHIVGQRAPRLDVSTVLSDGKIFLAKLSQGLIGEENASLLGSLLATRFHQLALARQQTAKHQRRPFFLYADEAQHFVTPSMASLLTDVRKYNFGLVLAHQNLFQIRGSPVESALLGNAYTRVAFRVGDEDAKRLAEGCSFFEARDFRSLARGEAVVRVGIAEQDFNLQTLTMVDVPTEVADRRRTNIVQSSRQAYALTLSEVRSQLSSAYAGTRPERQDDQQPTPRSSPYVSEPAEATQSQGDLTDTVKAVSASAPRRIVPPPPVLPILGRGGKDHQYLQHLIKRLAEERGFRATIEEAVGDGQADVVLRRGGLAVACEVSVTTDTAHEMDNVRKCFSAGFQQVALICSDARRATRYRKALTGLTNAQSVVVLEPGAIVEYLETFEPEEPLAATVRGYTVRINRQAHSPEEAALRRRQVAQTIARSLGKAERERP